MDEELVFLKKFNVLQFHEYKKLKSDRQSFFDHLNNKSLTKEILMPLIRTELKLLRRSEAVMQSELHKDVIELDLVHSEFIKSQFIRVFDWFHHMHVLFSIEDQLVSDLIDLSKQHVNTMNAGHLDILLDIVVSTNKMHLWEKLLSLFIKTNDYSKIINVFNKGVSYLKNYSLPLWFLMIGFLQHHPQKLKELFDKGCSESYVNISFVMSSIYLEWCIQKEGLAAARELFIKIMKLKPNCIELYKLWIKMECDQDNFELENIRCLYRKACELFGEHDVGIWVDYIRFEYEHDSSKLPVKILASSLCRIEKSLMNNLICEIQKLDKELKLNVPDEVIVIDDD